MKAKDVSLLAIIFAAVWVVLLTLGRAVFPVFTEQEFGLSIPEIIATGVFFVVIFSPIYRSIWLDKKLQIESDNTKSVETMITGLQDMVKQASQPTALDLANVLAARNDKSQKKKTKAEKAEDIGIVGIAGLPGV